MPLTFIQSGRGDYDAIRALLGVTALDVRDTLVDSAPFGESAERDFRTDAATIGRDADTLAADPDSELGVRLAVQYLTAAKIADTYARGGFVGLIRPSDQARDWTLERERLLERYRGELRLLEVVDTTTPAEPTDYVDAYAAVGGPTRARKARGAGAPYRTF